MNSMIVAPQTQEIVARIIGNQPIQHIQRQHTQEDRVIYRPHETVHETIRTTVEVIYFKR